MDSKIRQKQTLREAEYYVKEVLENDASGHDWWHIYRVRNLALQIAATEGGNIFIIEMAALLHDLDDWKLSGDGKTNKTKIFLLKQNMSSSSIQFILEIIEQVSFKGADVEIKTGSLEAKIVQDADRLDAIGAIGIARTFAFGGSKNRLIFNPNIQPEKHASFSAYKKSYGPSINHFYEKLLLLKSRMNTPTAQKIAENRHLYMEEFLARFYNEWEGKI